MKISVEEISPVKRSIRIELSKELVSEEFNHILGHLQTDARLPGFRPGKIPLAILKKKFNEKLQSEVLRNLLDEYCTKGIEEAGFSSVTVGSPQIHDINFKLDAPLFCTVVIDVIPKFKLENYTGLTLPTEEVSITEEDVEKGLGFLQQQQGYLEDLPEDHSIALFDYAIVDLAVEVEGKPFKDGRRMNHPLQVGLKRYPSEMEDALLGKKKGDKISVSLLMPSDNPNIQFAGKNLLFRAEVKEVKVQRLPALDDELAKDLGLSSLGELRERVKVALTAERNNQMKQGQKNILVHQLLDLHPIEVPQPMLERELESLSRTEQISEASDSEQYKRLQTRAARQAKASIILSAIANQEKIEVSEQEREMAVRQMIRGSGVPFEQGRKDVMENPRALRGLQAMVREEKALEVVYSRSKFEPVKKEVAC